MMCSNCNNTFEGYYQTLNENIICLECLDKKCKELEKRAIELLSEELL